MPFTTLFFDLDDTLYPADNGLWQAIRDRMSRYMVERLGISEQQVHEIRRSYYEMYGTTLRGLQLNYQVDMEEYLAYVHDLPLADFLAPNPALRQALLSLPLRRWIFTNADSDHAGRVLAILGLEECFEGVFDIREMHPLCKPEPAAFERALAFAGGVSPQNCVMLDDHLPNLAAAKNFGLTTVWVSRSPQQPLYVDCVIPDIIDLKRAMPQLW